MKKLYILTALLLIVSGSAFSQARLTVASEIDLDRDTIMIGEEVNGTYYVKNTGDTSFAGEIRTTIRTQKGSFLAEDSTLVSLLEADSTDSIQVNFRFYPSSTYFDIGTNIIVVWPTGTTINGDTLQADSSSNKIVQVAQSTTIFPLNVGNQISFYPNPAADKLYIEAKDISNLIYIKVYSLTGKELLSTNGQTGELNLSDLAPGVLLIETVLRNNDRQYYKVIKTY